MRLGIIPCIAQKGIAPVRESIREAYQAQYYPLGYVPAHDGMRGLMTLGVVVAHVCYQAVPGAVLYIDFFFAASAYYITSLLLRDIDKHGHIAYVQFYLRRFARLVPPLLLMLAVYLLCSWLFRPPFSSALARAAIVLSYTSNYWYVFDPKGIEDLGHSLDAIDRRTVLRSLAGDIRIPGPPPRRDVAPCDGDRRDRGSHLGMADSASPPGRAAIAPLYSA